MDNAQHTAAIFNKYAKGYQEKFMDVSLYHDTLDLFCESILTERADILEIACGPGNITNYLLKKRPDFNILGIDLATNMLDLARINNPQAEFQVMDARKIGAISKQYDGIMCGFCLPYLSGEEAVQLIRDASHLLRSDGVLYISTMEDDPGRSGFENTSSGEDQMYMNYHLSDHLVAALSRNGLEIIQLKRQDYPAQKAAKTTDLVIIAKK